MITWPIKWSGGLFGNGAGYRKRGLQSGESSHYPDSPATPVTQDTALCFSAFWASVKLISETVAGMPLKFYEVQPDGTRKLATGQDLAKLFAGKVNRYQTRFEFFESIVMQLAMHGNAYAYKQKNGSRLVGLLPMMSAQMDVTLESDGGAILYKYNNGIQTREYSEADIWHVKLMGNGVVGLSPLSYARNSIGLGLATDNATNKIYKKGAKPAGVMTMPDGVVLKPDQRQQMRDSFKGLADGDQSFFLMEGGAKYQQISMTPQDIELLSSRRFQIEDVARFMGVPSVLINDTSSSTVWGSGISEIMQGFYKLGLRPYLERIEASIEANLIATELRGKYEAEFDFKSILRGDMAARFQAYKEAVTGGFMTPNEARKDEGWQPLDGGDTLYLQQQMTPIEQLQNVDRGGSQPAAQNNNDETIAAFVDGVLSAIKS